MCIHCSIAGDTEHRWLATERNKVGCIYTNDVEYVTDSTLSLDVPIGHCRLGSLRLRSGSAREVRTRSLQPVADHDVLGLLVPIEDL